MLISRFYEQFSRHGSAMALERLFKKFQTFNQYEHVIYDFKAMWSGDFEYIIIFVKYSNFAIL